MTPPRRFAVCLVLALVVSACNSDGSTPPTSQADPQTTSTEQAPSSSSTVPAATATITIADFSFGAPTVVPVGEEVTVVNTDTSTHTWTASGGEFASGNLRTGDTFSFTFEEPGQFTFFCSIHQNMTGTITVEG